MASGNPMLSEKTLESLRRSGIRGEAMTVEGTTNKAMILMAILVIAAGFTWNQAFHGQLSMGLVMGGAIGGLILALMTAFKPTWAPITSPAYAAAEGLVLGGISAIMERAYPGIAIQAVGVTMGTAFAFLMAYRTGLIRATERFRKILMAATFGIMLFYLASFAMSFFGGGFSIIQSSSPMGIGLSVIIAGVAAFNLILDFDFIESGARQGAPKFMEWYGAFGLLVTLVWLYMEVLRLLSKLRER